MRSLIARVEADLGKPIPEFMAEAIIETGSSKDAAKRLVAATSVPVSVETARGWWIYGVRKTNPELHQWANAQAMERRHMDGMARDAMKAERSGVLAEIGQVKNGVDGKHCTVCGAPLPRHREATCTSRCAKLWPPCRLAISEAEHQKHERLIARYALTHRDNATCSEAYAKRVVAGEATKDHGRWTNSKAQRARLEEVMERRAQAKAKWGDLAADLPPIRALERNGMK